MRKVRGILTAGVFLLPNLLGFLAFTLLPVAASLALAFCEWDVFSPPRYVGLANFRSILTDPRFWYYMYNTMFLMLAIPVNLFGSLLLACLLNRRLPGVKALRTLYFLPNVVAGVGTMLLWRWMLNPEFGLINHVLRLAGLAGPEWLGSTTWSKPALMLMGFWASVGGMNMILYLAALQDIDPTFYEAADVDGAGAWRRFWSITWPMVSPTTFFILITGLIGGFQGGVESVIVMTGGGPAQSTTTIGYHIYRTAFEWFYLGRASAMSWILFMIILLVTLATWRYGTRRVYYAVE